MKSKLFKIVTIAICLLFLFCLMARWRLYLTPNFLNSSTTGHVLDTRFHYSIDEGYNILSGFSDRSFMIYKEILIWDMFLPIVYCYLALNIFSILPSFEKRLGFIPIIAMIFDYLENIAVYIVMINRFTRLDNIMAAANIFGSIKTIFQYITWLLIPIIFLVFIIQLVARKLKSASDKT